MFLQKYKTKKNLGIVWKPLSEKHLSSKKRCINLKINPPYQSPNKSSTAKDQKSLVMLVREADTKKPGNLKSSRAIVLSV